MPETNSKLVFISGGSRGIGQGLVRAFAAANFRVAFTFCHKKQDAIALENELSGRVKAFELDQLLPESIARCVHEVESHFKGTIDILINNGAIAQEKPFEEISPEDFTRMMDINLRGPFLLAQINIPAMRAKGFGRIINIGSIGGQWGGINQIHYAASKAGLINLTQSIARTYSAYGIRANTIAIGLVATEMTSKELESKEGRKKAASIPVGRLGLPEDISAIALFLASPQSDYISGQTINANGGMYFG